MKKRLSMFATVFLAVVMLASSPVWAQGAVQDKDPHSWDTDIRMSVTREHALMEADGMDLAAWDEAVLKMKEAGLSDPISEEAILKADKNACVLREDGRVYQIGPSALFGPIEDAMDAYRLAYRLMELLGGSSRTGLYLRSKLAINDVTVYSFQQYANTDDVLGGALKLALDKNNEVTAVFSGIDPEAVCDGKLLSREEAEAAAASYCEENGLKSDILKEYTDRTYRSPFGFAEGLNLDLDLDPVPDQLVWIVYTENEAKGDGDQAEAYPYLAHHILLDGTYLCNLPVKQPGDEEARSGYRKQELFDGLKADSYTGQITDGNGRTRTVTVPVMYSKADKCWYLGDVERRIAFADFYEVAYGEKHELHMVRSEDNRDWDSEDIYFFHNFLRAYDFYADMGWNSTDGEGTDVVVLKDLAYSSGKLYENAAYIAMLEGYQLFGYTPYTELGRPTGFSRGLDVLVHEYTHCFTSTVMNQNLYENDLGAINESMSDIFGNLAEFIYGDTDEGDWTLGENTGDPIRNMRDPEKYNQPSSVWGLYYVPKTDKPNDSNDRGGVHINSSLLNLIAAEFCTEYGMSYEEAVSLWTMTAMGMTPRTDYVQIGALLTWALEESGLDDRYGEALASLIGQTRIDRTDLPKTLPAGQKLVRLDFPDTETYEDEGWVLLANQIDPAILEKLAAHAVSIGTMLLTNPEFRMNLIDDLLYITGMSELMDQMQGDVSGGGSPDDPEKAADGLKVLEPLLELTGEFVEESQQSIVSWAETDTGVASVVMEDKPTVYFLANLSMGGTQINKLLTLSNGCWVVLMSDDTSDGSSDLKDEISKNAIAIGTELVQDILMYSMAAPDGAAGSGAIQSIVIEDLPTAGLESVQLPPGLRE